MKKTKWCPGCKEDLPIKYFYANKAQHDGAYVYCKICKRVKALARKHGITEKKVRRWIKKKCCSVCGRTTRLLVLDHNHVTGKIRGVLCRQCNSALGLLGDDVVWVLSLYRYLQQTDPHAMDRLREVNLALLDLFSVIDGVFTEPDTMSKEKRQISLGRIYEAWKRCRATLDPEFDPKKHDKIVNYGQTTFRAGLFRSATD